MFLYMYVHVVIFRKVRNDTADDTNHHSHPLKVADWGPMEGSDSG